MPKHTVTIVESGDSVIYAIVDGKETEHVMFTEVDSLVKDILASLGIDARVDISIEEDEEEGRSSEEE